MPGSDRRAVDPGLLGLFLGLVARARPTGRPNGAADDRTRRSGDRAADRRTGEPAGHATGARAGPVVTLGRLTGERAARRADRAADGSATKRPGTGTHGLVAVLFVLDRGAVTEVVHAIPVERAVHLLVEIRHCQSPFVR